MVVTATNNLNIAFSMYFVLEMAIKLIGLGPRQYVASPWNVFDGLVTLMGLADVILILAPNVSAPGGFVIIRALRILRVIRLARSWKSMNRIVMIMLRSLASVGWITMLLFLYLFIVSLLGMTVSRLTFIHVRGGGGGWGQCLNSFMHLYSHGAHIRSHPGFCRLYFHTNLPSMLLLLSNRSSLGLSWIPASCPARRSCAHPG